MASSGSGNSFWLSFRVLDDGLDAAAARRLTAANSAAGGPAAFALFPQLPAELRLKVWEYLLPGRVVQATCHDASASVAASPRSPSPAAAAGAEHGGYYRTYAELQAAQDRQVLRCGGEGEEQTNGDGRWREEQEQPPPEPQQIPVLLHVNHEARTLALRHYELAFAWKVPHVLAVNTIPGTHTYYYPQNHFLPSSSSASSPPSSAHASGTTTPQGPLPANLQQQTQQQQQPQHYPRTGAEARVYFSFARDMLYLCGELEPHDSFGFNSPMAYFVARGDAARVRRAALAFRSLRYGENGSQQIFGSLFHVVDRFGQGMPGGGGAGGGGIGGGAAQTKTQTKQKRGHGLLGNRVLVAVTPADEHTHALMGGEAPLVPSSPPETSTPAPGRSCGAGQQKRGGGGRENEEGEDDVEEEEQEEEPNVVQKIWRDWYRGSLVTSSLADTRFTLVREEDLARYL